MEFDFGSSIHLACWIGVIDLFVVPFIPFFYKEQSIEAALDQLVTDRRWFYMSALCAHALWSNGTAIFGPL